MSELFPVFAEHSRYVQRVRRRYAAELPRLQPGLPDRAVIAALIEALATDRPLASALRVARHLVMERLAVLDIEQGASVVDVTLAMTHLAEVTLDKALAAARAELDEIHGAPRTAAPLVPILRLCASRSALRGTVLLSIPLLVK